MLSNDEVVSQAEFDVMGFAFGGRPYSNNGPEKKEESFELWMPRLEDEKLEDLESKGETVELILKTDKNDEEDILCMVKKVA